MFRRIQGQLTYVVQSAKNNIIVLIVIFRYKFRHGARITRLRNRQISKRLSILTYKRTRRLTIIHRRRQTINKVRVSCKTVTLLISKRSHVSFQRKLTQVRSIRADRPIVQRQTRQFTPSFRTFTIVGHFRIISIGFSNPLPHRSSVLTRHYQPSFHAALSTVIS